MKLLDQTTADGLGVALYRVRPDGEIVLLNAAAAELLGYENRDALVGKNLADLWAEGEDFERWKRILETRGEVRCLDARWRRGDGSLCWVQVSTRTIRDEKGDAAFYEGSLVDITARVEHERYMRMLVRIVDEMRDAVVVSDEDGLISYVNEGFHALFGYEKDEVLGRSIVSLLGQTDDEGRYLLEQIRRDARERGQARTECVARRRDGGLVWVSDSTFAVHRDGADQAYWLSILRDITERKQAELALRQREEEEAEFARRLTRLHEFACEIASTHDQEDLCRLVAERAPAVLGLDRVGVWLLDTDGASLRGTFGVDEQGRVRDERSRRIQAASESSLGRAIHAKGPIAVSHRAVLWNDLSEAVGEGDHLVASVWDGEKTVGALVGDNLLTGRPITEREKNLAALCATAVGHALARLRAMSAAERERQELLSIFDGIEEVVYVVDPKTHEVLYANQALKSDAGEDMAGRKCYEAFQGLSEPCPFCTNDRIFGEHIGETYAWEFQNRRNKRWYRCNDRAIRWPDGRWVRCEIAVDITDRKRAEEELETLARFSVRLAAVADMKALAAAVAEASETLFAWDAFYFAWRKRGETQLHILSLVDTVDGEKRSFAPRDKRLEDLSEPARRAMQGEASLINRRPGEETPPISRFGDSSRPSASIMLAPVRSGEETIGLVSVQSYTTERYDERDLQVLQRLADACGAAVERVYAEENVRRAKQEWERTFDATPDLVAILDTDFRIVRLNKAMADRMGVPPEEAIGLKCYECVHGADSPPSVCPCVALLRDGGKHSAELHEPRMGGDFHVSVAPLRDEEGRLIGVVHVARDISELKRAEEERRRLEAQMQHAERLKSLGVLAGGVAHDFNNLLTAIMGNAELALHELPPSSPACASLQQILLASRRAADLTSQMLAYSGRGRFIVGPLNLSKVVKEMGSLLASCTPKKVELKYELAEELPYIEADRVQIQQVVMNLITNAAEAIGEDVGVITIRTGVMYFGEKDLADCFSETRLPEGDYVFLEVQDTGCGMSEETRRRMFDPFFTTKFTGRGLGLSAVLGIMRGHNGGVCVESKEGEGARVRVLFPIAAPPAAIEPGDAVRPGEASPPLSSEALVLLVEDEEAVRKLAKTVLEARGAEVLAAADGEEGIELFRRRADQIDAVVLDLTMPKKSGRETLEELRRTKEDVPVVLTSGFDESVARQRVEGLGAAAFLQKPYDMQKLADTVMTLVKRRKKI